MTTRFPLKLFYLVSIVPQTFFPFRLRLYLVFCIKLKNICINFNHWIQQWLFSAFFECKILCTGQSAVLFNVNLCKVTIEQLDYKLVVHWVCLRLIQWADTQGYFVSRTIRHNAGCRFFWLVFFLSRETRLAFRSDHKLWFC